VNAPQGIIDVRKEVKYLRKAGFDLNKSKCLCAVFRVKHTFIQNTKVSEEDTNNVLEIIILMSFNKKQYSKASTSDWKRQAAASNIPTKVKCLHWKGNIVLSLLYFAKSFDVKSTHLDLIFSSELSHTVITKTTMQYWLFTLYIQRKLCITTAFS
jgi:hypothetical protein